MRYVFIVIFVILSVFWQRPIIALLLGICLGIFFSLDQNFFTKRIATKLLQTGIILLGLSIDAVYAIQVSAKFMPVISVFVIITFAAVLLLGKVLIIDRKYTLLIAAGTSICGGTAMAALAPIIKSKPQDLAIAISVIFILNAFGILLFPIFAKMLDLSQLQFGAWAATAIHDTGAVIGASMDYGSTSLETATTLKLARTLWLIPLLLGMTYFSKNENNKSKIPVFIFFFILAVVIGSYVRLPIDESVIKQASQLFLLLGLFCIGSQISIKSFQGFDKKSLLFPVIVWLIIIPISYFIVSSIS